MDRKEIIEAVKRLPGIENLNALQTAMLYCKARRIRLLAPTGSGKTIAFGIALMKELKPEKGRITGAVIVPTRELAIQVRQVLASLIPSLRIVSLYGGHAMHEETGSLSDTPDIVVATPGRLLDHVLRHTVSLQSVHQLVIDEYDKCLELGFLGEMKRLARRMPHLADIVLTSATAAVEVPDFIDSSQARTLDFAGDASVNTGHCEVLRVDTEGKDKLDDCIRLVKSFCGSKTMIFVNHRESAERVYAGMRKGGIPAGLYHGGLDQQFRERALILLQDGVTPCVVTTDLGARGLDISDIDNIVHYHLPVNEETWRHRNGRTARMGADGRAFVLLSPGEEAPDYISFDGVYNPADAPACDSFRPMTALYFSSGKKDKISRGDILGFLVKTGGLESSEIGKIDVLERCAYAAVDSSKVTKGLLDLLNSRKIKNSRVRISPVE